MNFWGRTGAEKGEDGETGVQGDGHSFLGCRQRQMMLEVYYAPFWTSWEKNPRKTPTFKEEPKSFFMCIPVRFRQPKYWNWSSKRCNIHCIHQMWLAVTFSVFQLEKVAWWTTLYCKRRGQLSVEFFIMNKREMNPQNQSKLILLLLKVSKIYSRNSITT